MTDKMIDLSSEAQFKRERLFRERVLRDNSIRKVTNMSGKQLEMLCILTDDIELVSNALVLLKRLSKDDYV